MRLVALGLLALVIVTNARAQSFQNNILIPVDGIFNSPSSGGQTLLIDHSLIDRLIAPGGTASPPAPYSAFTRVQEAQPDAGFVPATNAAISATNVTGERPTALRSREAGLLSPNAAVASAFAAGPLTPGDRFSVAVGGSYMSQPAGAVTSTYQLANQTQLVGTFAGGGAQNGVRVGISFPFP